MRLIILALIITLATGSVLAERKPIRRRLPTPQEVSGCGSLRKMHKGKKFSVQINGGQYILNKTSSLEKGDFVYIEGTVTSRQLIGKLPVLHVKKIELCDCCSAGMKGDLNKSGDVDISDFVDFIATFRHGAPEPVCYEYADMNGDGVITDDDIEHLMNYMFLDGPTPVDCEIDE